MRISAEKMWINVAKEISQRSTCERLKVGAVITDEGMMDVHGVGYNGNYSGGPNTCDTDIPGSCGCLHSEVNALMKTDYSIKNKKMFCTDAACVGCAKLIINAKIVAFYYDRPYRKTEGLELMRNAGIKVTHVLLD